MSQSSGVATRQWVEDAVTVIERFVRTSREPVLIEPGEDPFPLGAETFSLSRTPRGIILACWRDTRTLSRRVTAVDESSRGQLLLTVERFGKRTGTITIADLAIRQDAARTGQRLKSREQFRRFLSRQFAGWKIAELTVGSDIEHSLSPAYPRALLTRGASSYAAISAPYDSHDPDGVLTFGLIWLDYLRRRTPDRFIEGLALFVPSGAERTTCDRVRHLRGAQFRVFAHTDSGDEYALDLADYGNFSTRIEPWRSSAPYPAWLAPVLQNRRVEQIPRADGGLSLRVHGLEFARLSTSAEVSFGIDRLRTASQSNAMEIQSLVEYLAGARCPSGDIASPLFRRYPEAWLEARVRDGIDQIDASLHRSPVYGQVPAFAAGDRGVIDLLAQDRDGRLAVLELKASEDIHLPLQALDYWMRVQWHLDRGEFSPAGYFPGVALRRDPPKLYLLAPAFEFHPANETILRYFASDIAVERVGLSLEWRQRLRVVCRSANAASFYGTPVTENHGSRRIQRNPSRNLESQSG